MESFSPSGVTQNTAVTGTSARLELRNVMPGQPSVVRLANVGTDVIFLAFGDSTVTATTAAGMPMIGNSVECFSIPQGATHVAAISAGTASTLYETVGEGL